MPTEPFPTIRDVARALETWAPPGSAQSYDNVGLQVGDGRRPVRRALIALDCTPAVLEEARTAEADLILIEGDPLSGPASELTVVRTWIAGTCVHES